MKVIFLDVDGVLNNNTDRQEHGMEWMCPYKVALLSKIVIKTGAKVVVSSDWRLAGTGVDTPFWRALQLACTCSGERMTDVERETDEFLASKGLLVRRGPRMEPACPFDLEVIENALIGATPASGAQKKLGGWLRDDEEISFERQREAEINRWVAEHPGVEDFIALDDMLLYLPRPEHLGEDRSRLVLTNDDQGLTVELADLAIRILNGG